MNSLTMTLLNWFIFGDMPYNAQYGFQDPATTFFEKLIDFHHDMLFVMIVVLVLVSYMLITSMTFFSHWFDSVPPVDVRYNTKIETIWTTAPTITLMLVVIPAFSLIYSMDDNSANAVINIKISGNQWYWNYGFVVYSEKTYPLTSTRLPKSSVTFAPILPYYKTKHPFAGFTKTGFYSPLRSLFKSTLPLLDSKEKAAFWSETIRAFKAANYYYNRGGYKINPTFGKNSWSLGDFSSSKWARFYDYFLMRKCSKCRPVHMVTAMNINKYLSSKSLVGGPFRLFYARVNPYISVYASKHFVSPGSIMSLRSFDSNMVADEDIRSPSQVRLLSVDRPLILPVGVPIRLSVTASDVIHSWAIPSFGVKLDATPGRTNTVTFTIKRPGVYYGQCSEICGTNHAFMPIQIKAVRLDSLKSILTYL